MDGYCRLLVNQYDSILQGMICSNAVKESNKNTDALNLLKLSNKDVKKA